LWARARRKFVERVESEIYRTMYSYWTILMPIFT